MIQVRYTGIANPRAAFDELRPLRKRLIDMQDRFRPFGPDYHVLAAAQKALDTAAFHFTGDPSFFAVKPEQSRTAGNTEPGTGERSGASVWRDPIRSVAGGRAKLEAEPLEPLASWMVRRSA